MKTTIFTLKLILGITNIYFLTQIKVLFQKCYLKETLNAQILGNNNVKPYNTLFVYIIELCCGYGDLLTHTALSDNHYHTNFCWL